MHVSLAAVYENAEKIVLVMEFASGGELYDYIDDKKGLEDREARKFFRQIVSAVNYLHQVSAQAERQRREVQQSTVLVPYGAPLGDENHC